MSELKNFRFGHVLRAWQRECAMIKARFLVLVLHRRAGKTELALKKLLDSAVKNQLDLPLYFYVAPLLKQAKTIAWTRLKQMVSPLVPHGIVSINEAELYIKFNHNGAMVRIYGADNPDAMRGVRLDGCVLDEVAQMKPEVWEEIIQPALTDRKGWSWFIGTPKGVNLFSQLYYSAPDLEGWDRALYNVYETDTLEPEQIEQLKLTMSEQAFAREFMCDFAAAGDDQLISLTDTETATQNKYKPGEMDYAPIVLALDPARFGDDRSVIFVRQGLQSFDPIVNRGKDNMHMVGVMASQINTWKPDAVNIDAGGGAGIIDRLRQLGYPVNEVNFGGKSSNPLYTNKRTEMWFEMADWVRSGGSIPNDKDLKLELSTPLYSFDNQNRKKLESKDEIKKRLPGSGSPDLADALALTFAFPVVKAENIHTQYQSTNQQLEDYDVFADILD